MKLLSLTMGNFMPFKGDVALDFPLNSANNVMIVFGDNMRGKTSLLNAVRWVLYGRALGRHLREIPLHQLLNTDAALEGNWTVAVHLCFEASGHTYDLRRRAQKKPLVAQPTRPEDFEITLGLQKDGMPVRSDLIDAEINQVAPEQVSRFFLFDGELLQEYETLLIEGSEQGKRIKGAIEQVLGVPALINGRDEIGVLLKAAQKQQTKDLSHVAGLERQAEQQALLQEKQQAFEADLADLQTKLNDTQTERTRLDDELEAVDSVYKAKLRLDALMRRQREIFHEQKDRRSERLLLVRNAWRDLLAAKLSIRRVQLLDEQRKLTEQIERRSALETRIRQIKKLLSTSVCPTCGQGVYQNQRSRAGTELGTLQGDLRALGIDREALSRVSAELATLNRLKPTGIGPEIRGLDADLRRLDVELTKLENEVETLRDEITGYDTAEISRIRAFRDQLLKEEGRLQRDIADRQKRIDEVKKELAIIGKMLEGQAAARASRSTATVGVCLSLERVFAESIERLRDDLRKRVQGLATEAFRQMTTQTAYKSLEINANYGLTIVDDTNRQVTVRSAGAEQIVALSLIDGLSRTGRAAGPIMMDTPFGRLDLRHRENILRYLPTTTSQLILLVHSGEIRRETDLVPLDQRIGAVYEIREVNPRESRIERVTI
jgi:DNA sulfur modification protein DndD